MMNVRMKSSYSRRPRENVQICGGSSNSWILQIQQCPLKIYRVKDYSVPDTVRVVLTADCGRGDMVACDNSGDALALAVSNFT